MEQETPKNSKGRPSDYSKEIADKICEKLIEGKSLRSVCKEEEMPAPSTVFKWLREHKDFSEQYARAKQESSDAMAEEILDIGDEVVADKDAVAKARLQVDTRKWLMAKMKPKKYGEQIDVTSGGDKIAVLPAELYAKRNSPPSTEQNSAG